MINVTLNTITGSEYTFKAEEAYYDMTTECYVVVLSREKKFLMYPRENVLYFHYEDEEENSILKVVSMTEEKNDE